MSTMTSGSMQYAPVLLSALVLLPAVLYDISARRIPNWLCVSGFVLGIVLHGLLDGWSGAGSSLLAGLSLLAGMFVFFAIGWLGAGDVKLLAAAGAIGGSLSTAVAIVLTTVVLGAAMGLVLTILGGQSGRLARKLKDLLALTLITKRLPAYQADEDMGATTLPYAIPIAAGSLLAMTWQMGLLG